MKKDARIVGRTTRMLANAIQHALAGENVHVISATTEQSRQHLRNAVVYLLNGAMINYTFTSQDTISIQGNEGECLGAISMWSETQYERAKRCAGSIASSGQTFYDHFCHERWKERRLSEKGKKLTGLNSHTMAVD